MSDDNELAGVSPRIYQLFVEAQHLYDAPNLASLDQAITAFQQVIDAAPRFAFAYAELSWCYLQKYRMEREDSFAQLAAQNAERCLRLRPDSARGLLAQTQVYLFNGKNDAALASVTRGLRVDPMDPDLLLAKARVFRALADRPREEQVYRAIIRDRPNYWLAYNSLGNALFADARFSEAEETYRRAAVLSPRDSMPLANIGLSQLEIGKLDDAIVSYNASLARAPNAPAYEGLGNIAFVRRDYGKAIQFFTQARDLEPRNYWYWVDIGDCFKRLHQLEKAKESYQKGASLLAESLHMNSTSAKEWMMLGLYHAKAGDLRAARSDMQKADASSKGAGDLLPQFARAQILDLLGEHEQATLLILQCLDRGLRPWDLDSVAGLDQVKSDPRYMARIKSLEGSSPAR